MSDKLHKIQQLLNRGEVELAQLQAQQQIEQAPEQDAAWHLLAQANNLLHGPAAAIVPLRRALQVKGSNALYWHQLASCLDQTHQPLLALDAHQRALALAPNNFDFAIAAPAGLLSAQHIQELIESVESKENNDANANTAELEHLLNLVLRLATELHAQRRTDQAEPWFARAMALCEAHESLASKTAQTSWEYAMQKLLAGNYQEGWKYYDARLANPAHASIFPFTQRRWRGENLAGKTILVHGEQGIGDEIMFASILPEIIAEAEHVIIACAPQLQALFERSFPQTSVESLPRELALSATNINDKQPRWLEKYPAIAYQCPIGSLARWRRKHSGDFPKKTGYLITSSAKRSIFREKLAYLSKSEAENENRDSKPLIGLAWQANLNTGAMGVRKSLPSRALTPLLEITGVQFVSLHLMQIEQALSKEASNKLIKMGHELHSFDDTAALVAELDLVISVDTATAHLAAALDKPTLVPLWFAADWRYGHLRNDCDWYPNMQLFRQTSPGDWSPVLTKLISAIKNNRWCD